MRRQEILKEGRRQGGRGRGAEARRAAVRASHSTRRCMLRPCASASVATSGAGLDRSRSGRTRGRGSGSGAGGGGAGGGCFGGKASRATDDRQRALEANTVRLSAFSVLRRASARRGDLQDFLVFHKGDQWESAHVSAPRKPVSFYRCFIGKYVKSAREARRIP